MCDISETPEYNHEQKMNYDSYIKNRSTPV